MLLKERVAVYLVDRKQPMLSNYMTSSADLKKEFVMLPKMTLHRLRVESELVKL